MIQNAADRIRFRLHIDKIECFLSAVLQKHYDTFTVNEVFLKPSLRDREGTQPEEDARAVVFVVKASPETRAT